MLNSHTVKNNKHNILDKQHQFFGTAWNCLAVLKFQAQSCLGSYFLVSKKYQKYLTFTKFLTAWYFTFNDFQTSIIKSWKIKGTYL